MKRRQGILLFLSVIYAFCIVYGNDIMKYDTVEYLSGKTWGRILFWTVIMCIITNLCSFLISKICRLTADIKIKDFKASHHFGMMWVIILLGWLPVYLACYPGLGIYDGPCQLAEITTHHPLAHTLFIHGMNMLAQRLGGISWLVPYTIIQMGLLAAAFAYLLTCLKDWGLNSIYIGVVLIWIIFFPMNPLMGTASTKDTIFAVLFLLVVCELIKIIHRGGIYWGKRVNCVRFAFVCCWLCLLRNNGVYVLAAMAPFLMFYTKRYYKRIGLICMSIIVGYYIYAGPLMDVVQIPKGDSREAMTMIVQPLARIYREEGKSSLSQDEKEMIRRLFGNNTPWYESHISDAAKCQFDSREFLDHITKYMKLYIELGIRYPDVYLDAILANTYGNWYPHEILPDSTCYRMYFEFPEVSAKEHGSQFPVLYDFLQKLCRESTYLKVPFLYLIFCTGIVSWTILFLLAQIIIRKQYRKILAFVPFGALFLTILLGPVALLRYTYPLMVGIPVLFAIVYWDELSKRV